MTVRNKVMAFSLWCTLAACNNAGDSTTITIGSDSNEHTERKLDSLGDRIEEKAEQAWDSTKAAAKDLKNEIERQIEKSTDSNNPHKRD